MRFTELNLSEPLQGAIRALGYEETTPVQTQAIPPGLQGRDIVGCAQTGTGKTLAFVLPALERLLRDRAKNKNKNPRVVVLEPTRELVIQVAGETRKLAARTSLRDWCSAARRCVRAALSESGNRSRSGAEKFGRRNRAAGPARHSDPEQ